jgi:hypothetical protein
MRDGMGNLLNCVEADEQIVFKNKRYTGLAHSATCLGTFGWILPILLSPQVSHFDTSRFGPLTKYCGAWCRRTTPHHTSHIPPRNRNRQAAFRKHHTHQQFPEA